jgi:hypothetical protein
MVRVFMTLKIILFIFFFASNVDLFGQDSSSDIVYVISEKYTTEYQMRKNAREDISNSNIFIYRRGWFGFGKNVDSLANLYGFRFQVEGCTPVEGREFYNDEVINNLVKRNGKGWWEKFLVEESKLAKLEIKPLPRKQ